MKNLEPVKQSNSDPMLAVELTDISFRVPRSIFPAPYRAYLPVWQHVAETSTTDDNGTWTTRNNRSVHLYMFA